MLLNDLLKTAFKQVYRNKRRYKAAIIGTAMGIAGLIAVVTMGEAVQNTLGKNLELLGNATIVKADWDFYRTPRWHHGQYTEKDLEDLKKLPGVLRISVAQWKTKVKTSFGKRAFLFNLGGVDAPFFDTMSMTVAKGRKLTEKDEMLNRHVCVIGQTVQKEIFEGGDALGKDILVAGLMLKVVGVLGGAEDASYMETIFLPISVARGQVLYMDKLRHIYLRAKDWDTVPILQKQVEATLRDNQPAYADAMSITYDQERIAGIQTVVLIFEFFLFAAIAVTLVLGGLGITNVMLAVVNERTTEIGLRKAVGATEGMIVWQFLFESLTVSLIGAAVGILSGLGAVEFLQTVFETVVRFATFLYSVMGSVLIAVLLGVASGLVPAARAGRLSAVDAMRFE